MVWQGSNFVKCKKPRELPKKNNKKTRTKQKLTSWGSVYGSQDINKLRNNLVHLKHAIEEARYMEVAYEVYRAFTIGASYIGNSAA